jgi:hypothetical protein
MHTYSNALLDRIEVVFYSILTSCLSGVNCIQGHPTLTNKIRQYPIEYEEADTYLVTRDIPEKTPVVIWTSIGQAIVTIIIWMILGFAAGFLIGMIKPR